MVEQRVADWEGDADAMLIMFCYTAETVRLNGRPH
jgi:hypothetical protein